MAVLGLVVVVVGLIAVPAPGPGWLIVFIGVSIWASEFEWAQRLLYWGKDRLRDWERWLRSKPWWVSALVALGTAAIVACVLGVLRLGRVPELAARHDGGAARPAARRVA